jgi:gamma-tubulin complex component 2
MDEKLLVWNKKNVLKINTLKKTSIVEFYSSEDTINTWISKIFNLGRSDVNKDPLPIIQSLSINFKPTILKYFIDEKSLRELELIFRFLFTLSSIQHFLQKHLKFRFSKMVLCFINTFRFTVLYETDDLQINQDIDLFIYRIDLIIKQYLNNLFLTSSNIFEVFIELFTICLDFIKIEYKDRLREDEIQNYDERLEDIFRRLLFLCKNINCDYIFLSCLESLTKENVFRC